MILDSCFFPKQVYLWGSILEKNRLDTLVGALGLVGRGFGRAGRAGWVGRGVGRAGRAGWVGRSVGRGVWARWAWLGAGFGPAGRGVGHAGMLSKYKSIL